MTSDMPLVFFCTAASPSVLVMARMIFIYSFYRKKHVFFGKVTRAGRNSPLETRPNMWYGGYLETSAQ